MRKITITLILTALILFSCTTAALATQESPELYTYYGDNMLFRQNDEAIIAGTAEKGTLITCTLHNSVGSQLLCTETVAAADNTFSLSFTAPEGSFEEYTITLSANGEVFRELTGVVFGELWLAGGQSNMHWVLASTAEGYEMAYNNKRGSSAIRIMYAPHPGNYKGDANKVPSYPLTDYETAATWHKGDDVAIFNMTAIGYFFAESMLKELNVPIGILDANLGGSSILTWLPREAIEGNPEILNDCKADNRYIPLKNWNENNINFSLDMTANFNKIIAPLKNFRLSGMIWYQGEGDVAWNYGRYTRAFNALQDAYTAHFNYSDGSLPIVFTQLASYSYGNLTALQNTNVEFSHIQQLAPESRALTSILDTPHDYTLEGHPIHPYYKKDISEKIAYAAKGLVYNLHDSYTAATVAKTETKDGSIYVTFRDVGDGLMAEGDTLHAFTICGNEGVYVSAKAEIVSDDTVKVYSPSVPEPKSVAYAYSQSNLHANLFASRNGEKLLAVSPFITDMRLSYHHWHNDPWATCDFESFWRCHSFEFTGYYNTWNSKGAQLTFGKSEIDTGNALYLTATENQFSISPNLTYKENNNEVFFQDVDLNWADYDTITFKVKVNSADPVQFDGLKLKINNTLWVMPAILGKTDTGITIAADGKTHTVTLDLNRLYPYGDTNTSTYAAGILNTVRDSEFTFSDKSGAKICFDDISFRLGTSIPVEDQAGSDKAPNIFERIKAFFISLFSKISLFFKNLF